MGHVAEELLGQLLCDGAAAASALVSHQPTLYDGAPQGIEVDAGVLKETGILRGNEGVDERRWQLVVVHHDAVLAAQTIGAQQLAVC